VLLAKKTNLSQAFDTARPPENARKKLVLIFRTLWTELKEKEKHLFKKSNSSETLNICVVFVRQTEGQKLRRRIEIVFLILRKVKIDWCIKAYEVLLMLICQLFKLPCQHKRNNNNYLMMLKWKLHENNTVPHSIVSIIIHSERHLMWSWLMWSNWPDWPGPK